MSATHNPEQIGHRTELQQTVRAHAVSISAQTGLPKPKIELVRLLRSRTPRINAWAATPSGVRTIRITDRTVRELSHSALRFLLTHEFGHFANLEFRRRGWRRYFGVYVLAAVVCVIGMVMVFASVSAGNTGPGFLVADVGLFVGLGGFLALLAHCRVDEYKADDYAARRTGDLIGAREFFAALENDQPSSWWTRATRMLRTHPLPNKRFAAVEATLARNDLDRSAS